MFIEGFLETPPTPQKKVHHFLFLILSSPILQEVLPKLFEPAGNPLIKSNVQFRYMYNSTSYNSMSCQMSAQNLHVVPFLVVSKLLLDVLL